MAIKEWEIFTVMEHFNINTLKGKSALNLINPDFSEKWKWGITFLFRKRWPYILGIHNEDMFNKSFLHLTNYQYIQ